MNKRDKKISSLEEDISNKITKFYASNQGETHLADSDNGKIMDMMLYGRSEQKQYRGKNLLPTTMYSNSAVRNGVTFTNNGDGSVTVSGTATDITYFSLWGYNVLGDKGVLQGITPGDVLYASDCLLQQTNSKEVINVISNGSTQFKDSTTTMYVAIRVNKGESVNKTFYPQIEKGSEATFYEPYVGGQPSPSPNYPQEIKSVVNPTVKVTNEDGLKVQSVTLNNITLNAIPVSSGGNVTINGQQYIADYVDVEREKLVKKLKSFTISDIEAISTWGINENADNITGFYFCTSENGLPKTNNDVMTSTILRYVDGTWGGKNVGCAMSSDSYNNYAILSVPTNMLEDISSDENACASLVKICENTNAIFFYSMASPIETDLTPEEIEAFKELVTYYPVTNISVNSEQLDGYTVFNYPISMKNGWDYVKKQLNDNRDYIYNMDTKTQDMDTQAAEAYVNSEYAVALTELEV